MFKCWEISKNRIHVVLFKTKLKYENNICVATPSNLQRQTEIKKKNAQKQNSVWAEVYIPTNTYGLGESIDIQWRDISEALHPL